MGNTRLRRNPRKDFKMAEQLFDTLNTAIQANKDKAKKINGVFQWELKNPDASYVIDLKEFKAYKGKAKKADVTLTLAEKDFMGIMQGNANAQQLFMSGKIKFKGNMGLLMKLRDIQKMM